MKETQQPDGLKYLNDLRSNGFTDEEIQQEQGHQSSDMLNNGFSTKEIRDYWGQKDPDMTPVQNQVAQNIKSQAQEPSAEKKKREPMDVSPKPVAAEDIWDAMAAGWGNSILGLAGRKEQSPIQMTNDNSLAQTFVSGVAQQIGDAPATVAGLIGGLAVGGPITAAAGAFGVPQAMRKALIDYYEKGTIKDSKDAANRFVSATWEGAKGAITGGAMMATGGLAGGIAGGLAGPLAETAASLTGQVVSMATVSQALEGHLPNLRDFENAAIAIGGLHALSAGIGQVSPLAKKMMNIYKETGAKPSEVIDAATNDPAFKGELLAANPDLPIQVGDIGIEQEKAAPPASPEEPPASKPVGAPDEPVAGKAQDEILSRIGEDKTENKTFVQQLKDDTVTAYSKRLDFTSAVKDMTKEIGNEDLDRNNAHVVMRLHAAVQDKLREFVEHGTRDFNTGNMNGESYENIIGDLQKSGPDNVNKFNAYRIAIRSLDLNERGISKIGDRDVDAQFVKDNQAEMQPYMDRYVAWRNKGVDYLVDSGRYSKESGEAMKAAGKNYAPLKVVLEPDPITGKLPSSSKEIKEIVGSQKELVDPFKSDLKDMGNMIKLAHETEAANIVVKNMIDGKSEEIRLSENQQGLPSKTQIATYEDGKRTLYDVSPDIADAVNRLAGNKPMLSAWAKLLKIPATLLRLGTVDNPVFGIRHAERQQITAGTLSKTNLKPYEAFLYAPEFLAKSEEYHNFVYDGGAVSSIVNFGDDYINGKIHQLDKNQPFLNKSWNTVKTVGEFSHAAIIINDNMIRFAEYKRMLVTGASRAEAAFAAREVLPDFQKAGLNKSAWGAITAFLDVHLQGQARMFQALKENPTAYVQKNLAYVTAPSLALYLANRNDDAVNDLPRWQRYNYWIFHPSDWRPAHTLAEAMSVKNAYPSNARQMPDGSWQVNDGPLIRVQKPFTNGIVFGSMLEATLDAFREKNPKAFEDFALSAVKSLIPEVLPTAVTPVAEQWTNRNFYSDQPLVRQSMENKLPEYQYKAYTSQVAKALGKALSYVPLVRDIGPDDAKLASPEVVDNYLKAWGGTLGQYAVSILDRGIEKAGLEPEQVKPLTQLQDIPFIKEFLIRYPNAKPQSVMDFEERYKKADRIVNTIKSLIKEGNYQEATKVQDRYSINMERLSGIDKAIQNLNAVIQKTNVSPGIEPDQKRQIMQKAYFDIVTWAKHGNKLMDDFEKNH